ncbi:MAG TPA: hypothetical protein VKB71_09715, partial [Rhizomicrobium sp.]|nr:hypothetical protein [Rhizomicrobium sp.]
MRHSVRPQRDALRAKLLFGVAAIAASDPALANQAATAPPDDSKWSPYSSIGGSAGSGMVGGKLDIFVPLFQNMDSLVFLNLGIGTETKARTLYNIGGGYRSEIDADWIVGAYVSYDNTQLRDNNNLGQAALGAELMSADWDVRLNGYIADNTAKPIPGEFGLSINGTTIAVLQAQDVGYSGFDGEIGYRVFADDNTDVRVFIGGFHFMHADTNATSTGEQFDFSYRDITGPKARAEVTVYDLDVLGNQSRLTLAGEIAHDDVRGTTGVVGATLRVALGNFTGGSGAQALSELDRRMVDPERRNDMVLNRSEFTRPEPVIIYGNGVKSQPTNTLLYVDNTQGVGTYANPTTFADATARPTTNAFIVLTSKQGPIMGGGTLQPGQTVVAGGETFSVQGVYSHATFSHLFDPSTNVTLMPSSPGANVITLAPDTTVHGFNIVGDFGNAIYGKNVHDVTIDSVAIEGTGGGVNGINIVRTVSGDQKVSISNTSVADVSGVGIRFNTRISDGGASNITTTLNNVVVTRVGREGLQIDTYSGGGGTSISSHVSVSNFRTFAAGAYGVDIFTYAGGLSSTINESLVFSNDLVSGPLEDGIYIGTYAGTASAVTSNVSLSDLTIQAARHHGIDVNARALGTYATLTQTLSITDSTIARSAYDDVALDIYAGRGGQATANTSLSGLVLNGGTLGGLSVSAAAYRGSVTNQTLTIDHVDVYNTGGTGVGIRAFVQSGAHVTETASLSNSTITGAGDSGVEARALAYDTGSSIAQTLQFSNLHISNAGAYGLTVTALAIAGAVQQSVSIANTEVSGVGTHDPSSFGVEILASELGNGYVHQATAMTNTRVADVSGKYFSAGIDFVAYAENEGATVQTQTIASSSATDAGTGLRIAAAASDCSCGATTVDQRTTVTNGSFDDNALRGIAINGSVSTNFGRYTSQSAIYQGVTIANTTLERNGAGLGINSQAYAGGSVTQTVTLAGMEIRQNAGDGVDVTSTSHALSFAVQNVTFSGTTSSYNDISHNGGNGVFIGANTDSGANIRQNIDLYYTNVHHNGADGIHVANSATGYQIVYGGAIYYAHIQQNLLMGPGNVSHNAGNGIAVYNTVKYGAALDQIVQVYKLTVDHNEGDGFLENSAVTTFNGSGLYRSTDLHSNIYVYQSDLSHNGGNGIS